MLVDPLAEVIEAVVDPPEVLAVVVHSLGLQPAQGVVVPVQTIRWPGVPWINHCYNKTFQNLLQYNKKTFQNFPGSTQPAWSTPSPIANPPAIDGPHRTVILRMIGVADDFWVVAGARRFSRADVLGYGPHLVHASMNLLVMLLFP